MNGVRAGLAFAISMFVHTAGLAQELRQNQAGASFTVHLDPRCRPRMSVEEVIALAERAEHAAGATPGNIARIDLLSGADLLRWFPQVGPAQDADRWFWVVWLDGNFRRSDGPGGLERRGRLGWALYDDVHRTFVAGGFRFDADPLPPPISQPGP